MKKVFSTFASAIFAVTMIAGISYAGDLTAVVNTKVAQEVVDSVTPTAILADDLVYTMGIARTTAQDFIIKYTLDSGTFDVTPPIPTAAGGGGAATITLRSGGADQNFVEYEVDVTTAFTTATALTLNADINPPLAMETLGAKIICTVELRDLYSTLDTSGVHTATVLETAYGSTVTAPATGALVIDVAAGKKKFLVGGNQVTDVALGTLATDKDVAGVNSEDVFTPTAFGLAAGDLVNIVLTGDFSACLSAALGGVYIDEGSGGFGAGDITPATLTGTTATFTGIAGNALAPTIPIRMQVNGTTIIPTTPTTATASLNMVSATDNDRDYFTGSTLTTYSYNGTVVYPGVVIGSGYNGYTTGFRIVNRGANSANVYFQVQNYLGVMLPEQAYSGNPVAAGANVYITADDMLTASGLTITSSANGIISVESPSVDIFQITQKEGGIAIIPLTKTNNQEY